LILINGERELFKQHRSENSLRYFLQKMSINITYQYS